ncbi:alkaline shock response membrane anchor protein AmaP [Pseudonocardia sp. CA-107938]|uniref:alkaline shock response membrane anchor protein AmaP n=1 Tax=Pseudonocardia sp. CA-107938 TaxID=3240021 RepID=UPI003D8CC886
MTQVDPALRRRSRSAVARSSGGDRALAVLVGLVLLAAGVLVALLSYGVFGTGRAARPLLDPLIVEWLRNNALLARLVAIGGGIVLAVLGLVWAARSVRPEQRPDLRLEATGDTEILVLSGAIGEAVAEQARALPGVGKARARMVGTTRAPALRVTLWLADDCNVATVLEALEEQVLAPARAALGLGQLPVAVRLEVDDPPPPPRVT